MIHSDPNLDRAVKSLKSIKVGMTDASRRRLAVLCSEQVQARSTLSWLLGNIPAVRISLAATALGMVMVLGIAVLVVSRQDPAPVSSQAIASPVRLVSVIPAGPGGVTLEWKDGDQRVYTVLKSNDPRDFRRAEAHAVRGNRWTDRTPGTGEVVYYKVE